MNPYIQELMDRYGIEEDFLHILARNDEALAPLVGLLEQQGDKAAVEELKKLPELLQKEGYGKNH